MIITLRQLKNIIKETLTDLPQGVITKVHGKGPDAFNNNDLGNFSNLDKTNITPDEAFSAGCTVCGDESGQCGHGEVCSDCGCSHPDWSPSCSKNDVGASRSGLSARFAKEAEAKSAALSGATSFNDSLEKSGTEIDDEILGRIYSALLKSARVLQGDKK